MLLFPFAFFSFYSLQSLFILLPVIRSIIGSLPLTITVTYPGFRTWVLFLNYSKTTFSMSVTGPFLSSKPWPHQPFPYFQRYPSKRLANMDIPYLWKAKNIANLCRRRFVPNANFIWLCFLGEYNKPMVKNKKSLSSAPLLVLIFCSRKNESYIQQPDRGIKWFNKSDYLFLNIPVVLFCQRVVLIKSKAARSMKHIWGDGAILF